MGGDAVEGGMGGQSGGGGQSAGSGGVPDTAGTGGAGGEAGGEGCALDLCGAECVDTSIDATNCGECERACSNQNTSALTCAGGQCAPTCASGYGDCNVDDGSGADDGCETNLNDNATCGTTCANRVQCGEGEFCVDGVCEAQCSAPNTECGSACVNLDDTIAHCGECERNCSSANTTGTVCAAGECNPTCSAGFDDCNVDDGTGPDDGCETDIAGNAANCGACARACSDANATEAACNEGECAPTCSTGFDDCVPDDGTGPDDGCETDIAGNIASCGACGRTCSDANTTAIACNSGACAPTCDVDYADCNVDDGSGTDDGCETDLTDDIASCNACGRACSTANASETTCFDGICDPTCNDGFGDCSADDGTGTDDGCETDFEAPATCGTSCQDMVACSSGQTCVSGVCTAVTGVVKVTVPLSAGGQGQRYNLLHQGNEANPAPPVDLSGTSLVIRAYAPNAMNGNLSVFFLGGSDSQRTLVPFSTINAGFTDVVVPVPAAEGGFNPAAISVIRVEIEAPAESTGPWEQPATTVYFDSFTSLNGNLNDTFDTNPLPQLFNNSGVRPLAGSTQKYLTTVP